MCGAPLFYIKGMINMLTVGSFFAGVGGIDLGFLQTKKYKIVYANEIDKYPSTTYNANFEEKMDIHDIHDIKGSDIPNFNIMIGGFPCQAFSLAGYRKGFDDEQGRGSLFFELVRILKEKKKMNALPQVVFFENVKNLVSHDHGRTFRVILDYLEELGYKVKQQVLNATEYGNVPQNRERIYIVGFQSINAYQKFSFPLPIELTQKLEDCIDFNSRVNKKYYYTSQTFKQYNELKESIIKDNTVYQWRRVYVRENKSNVCPTLTANMGTGGHNVPLIKCKGGIRKLSPKECFNLQGFPKNFKLPAELSDTRLYKQAGNSVVVPVIKRIAINISDSLESI